MYGITKNTRKGGYESFDTEHIGELLPLKEDKEKLIFWKKEMVVKGQPNQGKNTLRNVNMFITITNLEKTNFMGITKKYYCATVKINAENTTDLLRFDSPSANLVSATGFVCVLKKGVVKDIEVSFPHLDMFLFIRIDHDVSASCLKHRYNAKADVLIYPYNRKRWNIWKRPRDCISLIGYSNIVPLLAS